MRLGQAGQRNGGRGHKDLASREGLGHGRHLVARWGRGRWCFDAVIVKINRTQHRLCPAVCPHSPGIAAKNACTTSAELLDARLMKVAIWFSPSPPPARSDSERKAMNGTPLA